jgi:hypothetical protein
VVPRAEPQARFIKLDFGAIGWGGNMLLRGITSSLLAMFLCACSTGPYKDQITAFDGALAKAQTAFIALQDEQATAASVRLAQKSARA